MRHGIGESRQQRPEERHVDEDAGPEDAGGGAVELGLGAVSHQPHGQADLLHHSIARVDARRACNALVLQALADVDSRGADLDAQRAVDAIPLALHAGGVVAEGAARFASLRVVGDYQRVAVEHRALKARIRTHVEAHLLAHEACVAVGGEAVEDHPEQLPAGQRAARDLADQGMDGREVADEGHPGESREADPQRLLGELARELGAGPGTAVQLHLLRPVAFGQPLHPHEDFGPHGLRAGVAAPEPAREGREEEQRQGGHDEQPGEQIEVLREDRQAEQIEFARGQVEQQGLASVPLEPGQPVVQTEQNDHRHVPQPDEPAADLAGVYLLVGLVEPPAGRRVGLHDGAGGRVRAVPAIISPRPAGTG